MSKTAEKYECVQIQDSLYRLNDCTCGSKRLRYKENESYTQGRIVCLDCGRKTHPFKKPLKAVLEWNQNEQK